MKKRVCILFICCLAGRSVMATSVVVKVEKDRIILTADTRRRAMPSGVPNSRDFHDDLCKIILLGNVGFAAASYVEHQEKSPTGKSDWSWSAYTDARTSYGLHPNDIRAMADDWRDREKKLFSTLYVLHPDRVKEIAQADTPLIVGHFAGWDNEGQPVLILEMIKLNDGPFAPDPIVALPSIVFPERDMPYSTNNVTENLIEHDPEKAIAKEWAVRSKKFPKSERDWRYLEFLIRLTAADDEQVGKDADVLEIRVSSSKWLQRRRCCPTQSRR